MKAREIIQGYKTVTASAKEEEWERRVMDVCYEGRTGKQQVLLNIMPKSNLPADLKRDEFVNPTYLRKKKNVSQ